MVYLSYLKYAVSRLPMMGVPLILNLTVSIKQRCDR